MSDNIRLAVGDAAPELSLPTHDGNTFTLSEHQGTPVIVYFYPRAETPGCTTQACDFRDNIARFQADGYLVVGVSPDKPEKLAAFVDNHGLPFTMLSDPTKETMRQWGAFGEKQNYGKTVQGVIRSTVVIGADGTVSHALYNVKAKGHVERLAKTLKLSS
ncbi:thioredoxin-dependent thiol peroxidase [Corynebacterium choanae]|uniref:thioredoxin-dependent peroxiredoxin n=1 Tax=Corynebacterium choanae TaxID=1862358 RepID=A0A3G6J9K0_9CORY|nr:thioredoxin-dependent thiol peroxidase [Corynebacterium choanae]AZA14443.1 Putative peroxiredoxin [Corynebacterium choanae]